MPNQNENTIYMYVCSVATLYAAAAAVICLCDICLDGHRRSCPYAHLLPAGGAVQCVCARARRATFVYWF